MPRRDVSTPQGEQCFPCLSRRLGVGTTPRLRSLLDAPRLLGLGALLTILGVFTLASCYLSRTIDQAKAGDVNNRNFVFTNGAVFHPALTNVATALAFSNNAQDFILCSGSSTATTNTRAAGTNRFGSCTLTVTTSNYKDADAGPQGPQINDVIKLDPCDFDSDDKTLTVSNRGITATSTAATTVTDTECSIATPATPSQLSNQSCTFANGGVFNSTLNNVSTTLAFPNNDNAQTFTLTSSGVVSGTASGTSSIVAGSCRLTVTKSTYPSGNGPPVGSTIPLIPCTFDSSDNTLTVSNLRLTVPSERCTTVVP